LGIELAVLFVAGLGEQYNNTKRLLLFGAHEEEGEEEGEQDGAAAGEQAAL
jgi:hypothetical protein